jgi:hypothetical protein
MVIDRLEKIEAELAVLRELFLVTESSDCPSYVVSLGFSEILGHILSDIFAAKKESGEMHRQLFSLIHQDKENANQEKG